MQVVNKTTQTSSKGFWFRNLQCSVQDIWSFKDYIETESISPTAWLQWPEQRYSFVLTHRHCMFVTETHVTGGFLQAKGWVLQTRNLPRKEKKMSISNYKFLQAFTGIIKTLCPLVYKVQEPTRFLFSKTKHTEIVRIGKSSINPPNF